MSEHPPLARCPVHGAITCPDCGSQPAESGGTKQEDQSREEAFKTWCEQNGINIRVANPLREAGFYAGWQARGAAEREAVANWMIVHSFSTGHGDTLEDLLKELSWQIKELREKALAERAAPASEQGSGKEPT